MPIPYRYSVRTIHGATRLESELYGLSSEGWEPISFQHDAAGNFEVILRRDHDERSNDAESARFAVRSIRTPKIESELTGLSNDGWEAISLQHEASGAYEVILRQDPNSGDRKTVPCQYALRSVRGATKLESELSDLSANGWELVRLQRDEAGTYEVILRHKLSS